jgi:signal transduction histidine kinase
MARNSKSTRHAPAERADGRVLTQQSNLISNQALLVDVLNAVSTQVVILNKERQIVFGNKAFLGLLGKEELAEITGLRVGEAIGCVHSDESDGGCGTTAFCKMCGAVNAMLSAQNGKTDTQECRIIQKEESKALDLRVMASPFRVVGEEFTVFSILDIADEKRRDVLERIFMHDLMNTAGGLRGFTRLLTTASEEDLSRFSLIVDKLAEKLVDEIEAHKQLKQAENADLEIQVKNINSLDLLKELQLIYRNHEVAGNRYIQIDPVAGEYQLSSDESLLKRVIGNMIKNALEAVKHGESVTLSCSKNENKIRFTVHNPGELSREASLQVFQRSFSTKGSGRGLGTYSMKLLSEQYLQGKVGFSSSPEEGTLFFAEYPVKS